MRSVIHQLGFQQLRFLAQLAEVLHLYHCFRGRGFITRAERSGHFFFHLGQIRVDFIQQVNQDGIGVDQIVEGLQLLAQLHLLYQESTVYVLSRYGLLVHARATQQVQGAAQRISQSLEGLVDEARVLHRQSLIMAAATGVTVGVQRLLQSTVPLAEQPGLQRVLLGQVEKLEV
jgi:hypothetical protein